MCALCVRCGLLATALQAFQHGARSEAFQILTCAWVYRLATALQAFQNGACSAGSSVCEVQDSEKGLNTYGFVDTIAITRTCADVALTAC